MHRSEDMSGGGRESDPPGSSRHHSGFEVLRNGPQAYALLVGHVGSAAVVSDQLKWVEGRVERGATWAVR